MRRSKTACLIIIGTLFLLNARPNSWSFGQEKKENKVLVSESVLDDCADNKFKAGIYKSQRDSLAKSDSKLKVKEKIIYSGLGFGGGILTIIILRLAIK